MTRPQAAAAQRPLKVVYVIDKMTFAGAQTHLLSLAAGLDRRRFDPRLTCLLYEGSLAPAVAAAGVRIDALGLRRIYDGRALVALARLVARWRRERPPIVHTYLSSANVYGAVAARAAGVPCLITSRRDRGFGDSPRLARAQALTSRWAARVVCVSRDVAEVVSKREHLKPRQLVVIENGIDLARFAPGAGREQARAALGLPETAPVLLMVGHLTPVKGADVFLEAAARISRQAAEARFLVAGGGPLEASLRRRSAELGLDGRFVLLGDRSDVPALLRAADVYVLPSRSEGQPNALIEGMATGLPCVAARVGGVPEIASDAEAVLVAPESPEALAAACVELLADPERARRLGAAARARVASERDAGAMVRRYERLYEEATGGAR